MYDTIKYLILDVDGTLTDSGIYYGQNGLELKKFSARDGTGILAAGQAGIKIIVITGRECEATERRMRELNIKCLYQGIQNKRKFIENYIIGNKIKREEIGYIGDDLNDLSSMNIVGFVGCPKDACLEIIEKADYVSHFNGGYGAVRDVIEFILRERDEWENIIEKLYVSEI